MWISKKHCILNVQINGNWCSDGGNEPKLTEMEMEKNTRNQDWYVFVYMNAFLNLSTYLHGPNVKSLCHGG